MSIKGFGRTNLRPIATWLTDAQLEQFKAIATKHNVSPTALLRAVVVDVIAEDGDNAPLPTRYAPLDLFALARQELDQ